MVHGALLVVSGTTGLILFPYTTEKQVSRLSHRAPYSRLPPNPHEGELRGCLPLGSTERSKKRKMQSRPMFRQRTIFTTQVLVMCRNRVPFAWTVRSFTRIQRRRSENLFPPIYGFRIRRQRRGMPLSRGWVLLWLHGIVKMQSETLCKAVPTSPCCNLNRIHGAGRSQDVFYSPVKGAICVEY